MTTGEKIKTYRKKKGMTQTELAEATGSTTVAISRYELGQREARYSLLKAIAKALDAPEEEFLESYPKEPLKISEYKERLSAIENGLRDAAQAEEPTMQIEIIRRTQRAFSQLLDEERFALKILEETRYNETGLIETRMDSMQGKLLKAFNRLNQDAQEKAIERIGEMGLVFDYQRPSLSNSLQNYIYNNYQQIYEVSNDTESQEAYESEDDKEVEADIRHILLVREKNGCRSEWHFYYYKFSGRPADSAVKEIVSQCESYDNKQDKYSFVLDDLDSYNQFISCHMDITAQIENNPYSDLMGEQAEITFFLINKDTWEIKDMESSNKYTAQPDDI